MNDGAVLWPKQKMLGVGYSIVYLYFEFCGKAVVRNANGFTCNTVLVFLKSIEAHVLMDTFSLVGL